MIKISRKERDILENDYGLRFNKDIHATFSKRRKYYLVETSKNLVLLDKIRKCN